MRTFLSNEKSKVEFALHSMPDEEFVCIILDNARLLRQKPLSAIESIGDAIAV